MAEKPLGGRAYGHIPHLPGSRLGPADHMITEGQCRILTEAPRDKNDLISVTEKVDGSCVAIANIDGVLVPLTRAGYRASDSVYPQHLLFGEWATEEFIKGTFHHLNPGERVIGEWLAQAHGTRYDLHHEPFVAFDLIRNSRRVLREEFVARMEDKCVTTTLLHEGSSFPIEAALEIIDSKSGHGAIDPVEGAVWRVERKGVVDFLAKWVRQDKADGKYLEKYNDGITVWNWQPNAT